MRSPTERLELIEQHLDMLRTEVKAVRLDLAPSAAAQTSPPASIPHVAQALAPEPAPVATGATADAAWQRVRPAPAPSSEPPRGRVARDRKQINLDRLFGASGLAWAGGFVTLLGIVFFFAMAIHRGWVSPEMRVVLGALASAGLIAVAHVLRGKFQSLPAALAAAGAGIAGLLTAVVASTRMYAFIPDPAGLTLALVIAAGGVALATRWDAEPVAAFGLAGAAFSAPIITSVFTAAGTWFVLVALVGSAAVAIANRWATPLVATTVVALPQLLGVIGDYRFGGGGASLPIALAATAWLVLSATGALWQLRSESPSALAKLTMPALSAGLGTIVFAFLGILDRDVPGVDPQAVGFLALGAIYLGSAVALLGRDATSPLLPILGAMGFAMEAVGLGEILGGPGRVLVFAAQAGALTWMARKLGEPRLRFVALADVAIAAGFALFLAPPTHLFTENAATLSGALATIAVAAGLGYLAWTSGEEDEQTVLAGVTGVGALYALGMSILALVQQGQDGSIDAIHGAFQRGQMAISIILGLIGLAALVIGVQRGRTEVRIAGVAVLAISLAKLFLYDLQTLDALTRALAFFLVGGALLAGGAVLGRRAPEPTPEEVAR
jgi:uncharacterized membrane protein